MGDIYHAGEVYAGSVPIDDTQHSPQTVYSSEYFYNHDFVITGQSVATTDWTTSGTKKVATVTDSRINSNSFIYVAFTDACLSAAVTANVTVESQDNGVIKFTADTTPSAALYFSVHVKNP